MSFRLCVVAHVVGWGVFATLPGAAAEVAGPWWAYGALTPPRPGEKAELTPPAPVVQNPIGATEEQTRKRHIEGSDRAFSLLEIRNRRDVVDWFPNEHPPMPAVVNHGPARMGENAWGCALCHMPHGQGRPENAPINGLPPAYFIRQLQDFNSGARASHDPRKGNTLRMIELAQAMTDEEMKAAADYYAAIPAKPWVRVIESELVPKTRVTAAKLFVAIETTRSEPIASRVMEVPADFEQFEIANPRSGIVAYVPPGSIRRGEILATTGGTTAEDGKASPARTIACVACHGPDLLGVGEIPAIAGRSPSYLTRQLYDFQQGSRKGALAVLMQPVVANLTQDDFVALAAYVSSRPPAPVSSSAVPSKL